jgi:hypothetical protein
MYHLPGLSVRATEVVLEVAEAEFCDWDAATGRPRAVSVTEALRLCLCWLRRNVTFAELGEDYGIATSTAWDYAHAMTAFLAEILGCSTDDLAEQVAGKIILVDGTLVPTWHWRHRRDLYSGKHHRYGINTQVFATVHGQVAAISRAFPGSWHDKHCFDEAAVDKVLAEGGGAVGDPGYQGTGMVTPIKKPPGGTLADTETLFNTAVAIVRVGAEWAIAHLKNWRILTTRYRGFLNYRIDNVLLATAGLQALNESTSERKLTFNRITKK